MSGYSEAERRNSTGVANPDSTVVDLAAYRRRRGIGLRDANAGRKPRNDGAESAGDDKAPAEDNRWD